MNDAKQKNTMKPKNTSWTLMFLLSVVVAGCMDRNQSRFVGTWEIETADKVFNRLEMPTENDVDAGSAMTIQFGGQQLTTTTRMNDELRQKQGTWQLLSFDEETQTATIQCTLGMQTTEHEVEFIDDRTIRLVPPNMAGLKLKVKFKKK